MPLSVMIAASKEFNNDNLNLDDLKKETKTEGDKWKPPPADPTDWVYTWLKEHGLEESAKRLLDANFLTRDDLLLEPRLDCTDLEKLGVIKAADRRKIFNLVKELS